MITDANDPWAMIRELQDRVRHLETRNPLENASISTGRIRILTPGGDGGSSNEEAIIGHAYGKKGLLVKEGGQWVTTKEFTSSEVGKLSVAVDGKIAASHEYPDARITSLEGFANAYGPTVNTLVTQMAGVDGKISASHTYPNNRIGDLEGRMSSAESSLSGKASVASVSSVKSKQDQIIDFVNKLQGFVFSQHSGTPSPPLVKG